MSGIRKTYAKKKNVENPEEKENVPKLRRTKAGALKKIEEILREESSFTASGGQAQDSFDLLYSSPMKQEVNFKPLSFWGKKLKDLEKKENTKKKKYELYELSDGDESSSSLDRKKPKRKGRAASGQLKKIKNKQNNNNNSKPAYLFDVKHLNKKDKNAPTENKGVIVRERIILNRLNEKFSEKEDKFGLDGVKSFGLTSTPMKGKKVNVVGGSSFKFLSPIPVTSGSDEAKGPSDSVNIGGTESDNGKYKKSVDVPTPLRPVKEEEDYLHYWVNGNSFASCESVNEQLTPQSPFVEGATLDSSVISVENVFDRTFLDIYDSANSVCELSSVAVVPSSAAEREYCEETALPQTLCVSVNDVMFRPSSGEWSSPLDRYVDSESEPRARSISLTNVSLLWDSGHDATPFEFDSEPPDPAPGPVGRRNSNMSRSPVSLSPSFRASPSGVGFAAWSAFAHVTVKRGRNFSNFRGYAEEKNNNPHTDADVESDTADQLIETWKGNGGERLNGSRPRATDINDNLLHVQEANDYTLKYICNENDVHTILSSFNCDTDESDRTVLCIYGPPTRNPSLNVEERQSLTLLVDEFRTAMTLTAEMGSNQYRSMKDLPPQYSIEMSFNVGSDSSSGMSFAGGSTTASVGDVSRNGRSGAGGPVRGRSPESDKSSSDFRTFAGDVTLGEAFELPSPMFESTVCKARTGKRGATASRSVARRNILGESADGGSVAVSPVEIRRDWDGENSKVDHPPTLNLKPGKQWMRSALVARKFLNGNSLDEASTPGVKGKHYATFVEEVLSMQVVPQERSFPPGASVLSQLTNLSINDRTVGNRTVRMTICGRSNETDCSFANVFRSISERGHLGDTIRPSALDYYRAESDDGSEFTSARDLVLIHCNQEEPLPFECYFNKNMSKNCKKIGEGVFGEVFKSSPNRVFKIIPIEGKYPVNGEPQKNFEEILSEMTIAMELSNLRVREATYRTSGFSELRECSCVVGKYPEGLIDLWNEFDCIGNGSENDSPVIFQSDQLYIVLEFGNGGKDLEAFTFNSAEQALSIFVQAAWSLAVAEKALEFEHRDLHWGNILIQKTKEKYFKVVMDDEEYKIPTKGLKVTIIDFTLSRLSLDGCRVFNDLSSDPSLFTSHGDYQFEIYRMMRKEVTDDWSAFRPKTNLFWLHYVLDKMLTLVRYRRVDTKIHKMNTSMLAELKRSILGYDNTAEFLFKEELT